MTDRTPLPPGLGAPATRALDAAGVAAWRTSPAAAMRDLLALHGVGPKAVRLLREAMAAAGTDPPAR